MFCTICCLLLFSFFFPNDTSSHSSAQQLASAISCGMVDDATKLAKLVTDLVLQQKRDSQASLGMFSLKFEPDKEAEPPEEKFTYVIILKNKNKNHQLCVFV